MDDRPPRRTRARWPRSARLTSAALAAVVVALSASVVVLATRPSADRAEVLSPPALSSPSSSPTSGRVQPDQVTPSALPVPAVDAEQAMVGPLFPHGLSGSHSCTGIVVASSQGDTVLTAAHCISGSARGWLFAPGYEKGATPDGVWTVTGQYVTSDWLHDQAPSDDFAVLTVAARTIDGRRTTLASAVGAAQLASTPVTGTPIRIISYNSGRNDPATTCVVPLRLSREIPTLLLPRLRRRHQWQPLASG